MFILEARLHGDFFDRELSFRQEITGANQPEFEQVLVRTQPGMGGKSASKPAVTDTKFLRQNFHIQVARIFILNPGDSRFDDVDVFSFKSDKDQRLICEVSAQRLGSRLDALLTLTDAAGKVLAQNDDTTGMDARIDYDKFKKDEEYRLSIRDLNDRGGEGFG